MNPKLAEGDRLRPNCKICGRFVELNHDAVECAFYSAAEVRDLKKALAEAADLIDAEIEDAEQDVLSAWLSSAREKTDSFRKLAGVELRWS